MSLSRLAAVTAALLLFSGTATVIAQCGGPATPVVASPVLPTATAPTQWRIVALPGTRFVQPAPSAVRGQRDCCKRKDPYCCPQRFCCIGN